MTEPALELRDVGKRYWKIEERSLVRSLVRFGPPNRTEFWALQDANLSVEQGETIGIVGRNGAGKSTLLRLLAGVTRPTLGTVVTRGRIAPLLSVGVGFHQEMTGRENVYVNGTLFGFGRTRIDALFDRIVEFADLADFIDTPVKFYSSGMYMRLGFSVAMHIEPDILLVDEVLAVGDIGFRVRCLDRMRELHRMGTTLVFVSHMLQMVQLVCPRTICMHEGRIVFDGPTETAIAVHQDLFTDGDQEPDMNQRSVRVLQRELVRSDGVVATTVRQDEVLTHRVRLRFDEPVQSPQVLFQVYAEDGTFVYSMQSPLGERWHTFSEREEAAFEVRFVPRLAGGGTFRSILSVTSIDAATTFAREEGPSFFVEPRNGAGGMCDLDATITIAGVDRTERREVRFGNYGAIEGA